MPHAKHKRVESGKTNNATLAKRGVCNAKPALLLTFNKLYYIIPPLSNPFCANPPPFTKNLHIFSFLFSDKLFQYVKIYGIIYSAKKRPMMYGYCPHICFCGVFWLKTHYRLKKRFSAGRITAQRNRVRPLQRRNVVYNAAMDGF